MSARSATQRPRPVADRGDHPGRRHGIAIRNAETIERLAHEPARFDLFVHQLGTAMDLPAQADHPVRDRGRLVEQAHTDESLCPSLSFLVFR
jgi:hypothetical protein